MEPENKPLNVVGGAILLTLSLYWFWVIIFGKHAPSDPPWVFLDYANLIFHEAGHVIFMFFGDFLHVLGGSLMQLLVPVIAMVAFIRQSEGFSAGFCLFWLGESANNLSYYIGDARAQALPLLGGDPSGHDWTWLLTTMHLLQSDTLIGNTLRGLAVITMLGGLYWMATGLYKQYQSREM